MPEAKHGRGRGRTLGAPAWFSEALSPVLPSLAPLPSHGGVLLRGAAQPLGRSVSEQKVGVSWRARQPGACPVEPEARRALSTSGPACRQILPWPRGS